MAKMGQSRNYLSRQEINRRIMQLWFDSTPSPWRHIPVGRMIAARTALFTICTLVAAMLALYAATLIGAPLTTAVCTLIVLFFRIGEARDRGVDLGFGTWSSAPNAVRRYPVVTLALPSDGGRFSLPQLPRPGMVTAAGRGGDVVLGAVGPDGDVEYLVHRSMSSEPDDVLHLLEVVLLADVDLPRIAMVWYRSQARSDERAVLIPIVDSSFGPAGSTVRLADLDQEAPWFVSAPLPLARQTEWDPDIVRTSVRSAADENTLRAWSEIARAAPEGVRALILAALP
jgi:hypothetical protein